MLLNFNPRDFHSFEISVTVNEIILKQNFFNNKLGSDLHLNNYPKSFHGEKKNNSTQNISNTQHLYFMRSCCINPFSSWHAMLFVQCRQYFFVLFLVVGRQILTD